VIVNATDLNETNFACMVDERDGSTTDLGFEWNAWNFTMTIKRQDGAPMNLTNLRSIHYGNNSKDLNLCDPQT